jgi:hypothetical protein
VKEEKQKDWFKKGFFLGRMIWFRDEDPERAIARIHELLLFCNTSAEELWTVGAMEFVQFLSCGVDRLFMKRSRVLLIRDLEGLSRVESKAFLRAIRMFRLFQHGSGIRLILLSGPEFPIELYRIHELLPVVIDSGSIESDPEDLDSRVHSLVEIASRVSERPIQRLTERAAHFLEETIGANEGEEVLLLLVEGMRRSKGSVLRLRDILPNFAGYFGSEDGAETYCN